MEELQKYITFSFVNSDKEAGFFGFFNKKKNPPPSFLKILDGNSNIRMTLLSCNQLFPPLQQIEAFQMELIEKLTEKKERQFFLKFKDSQSEDLFELHYIHLKDDQNKKTAQLVIFLETPTGVTVFKCDINIENFWSQKNENIDALQLNKQKPSQCFIL